MSVYNQVELRNPLVSALSLHSLQNTTLKELYLSVTLRYISFQSWLINLNSRER